MKIPYFKESGLLLKDKNGYLYPACEQASTVLDILRNRIKQLHVTVLNTIEISERDLFYTESGTWNIRINGKTQAYDAVILACGGYAGLKKKVKSIVDMLLQRNWDILLYIHFLLLFS